MKYLFFLWTLSLFGHLDVEVTARSAILMNGKTGAVLYEKNGNEQSFPASITKIATALYALDQKNLSLEQRVTVSENALKIKPAKNRELYPSHWNETDGTTMGLIQGEIVSFENLLYGMMRASGNDAANVMTEALSSSTPAFVAEMNEYLLGLGCKNTHFSNPHGLHHEHHYSTAYDMCLIARKALTFPLFREIVSNSFYQKPKTNKQPKIEIQQKNALVKEGKHFYQKAIGIKTGYHSNAMYTLVAAAEHEGRELIAVLLGCNTRDGRYQDAIRLFDSAFAEKEETKILVKTSQVFPYSIEGAKTTLQAALSSELALAYFPAEEPVCRAFVHWDLPQLPIRKGQRVGTVHITDVHGKTLQTGDLFSQEDVKPTFSHALKRYLGFK